MRWVLLGTVLVGLLLSACASQKPESQAQPEAPPVAITDARAISPEQNDAIDALFRRKAPELQGCWAQEYERTRNRKLEGDVTIGLTVTPSGKPIDVRVLKSTLASPEVEGCMTKTVATWSFPEMPANVPYLRTVHIGAEY